MQAVHKDPVKRKAAAAKKKADAKKKREEDRKALGEEAPAAEESVEDEPMPIDADDVEPLSVEDITDLGDGQPLFSKFSFEDWTLVSTSYELHLLLHAFKKDLDDADRTSFAEQHLSFYYNVYFKKPFNFKTFGVEKLKDLLEHVKEAVSVGDNGMLQALQSDETPAALFVKHIEEYRRERERRLDAGDETALLKFSRAPQAPTKPSGQQWSSGKTAAPAGKPTPSAAGVKRPMPSSGGPAKFYPGANVYGGAGYRR